MKPGKSPRSVCKASQFLSDLQSLQKGSKIVLWLRVSTSPQKEHLQEQEAGLRKLARKSELIVITTVKCIAYGHPNDPMWLMKFAEAIELCKKHDAILVAETTDRFIRNSVDHQQPPERADFEDLLFHE